MLLTRIYQEDKGISGKKADKRPAFQEMIATCKEKSHPYDAILLWKFSRFARNIDESTYYKSVLRKKCNVDVISISEPDRKSTRLNSSHRSQSRMPSSA